MNQPYDVRLEDRDNRSLYTLAMVFYVYGLTPTHEPVTIRNMLGAMPSDSAADFTLQRFLLDQGFTLHHVSNFDRERFLNEGRAYLMSYYGERWTEKEFDHWTDELIATTQETYQHEVSVLSGYPGWHKEVRPIDFSDVLGFLSFGQLVLTTHWDEAAWLRLSWAMDTKVSARIFEPKRVTDSVSSLGVWYGKTGFAGWVESEGILAISRP